MADYPSSVVTRDRKGNEEVRLLVDRGRFVRYQYMNPETGEIVEKEKMSIILLTEEGEKEHLYIIPFQPNRALAIRPKVEKKDRKVWNGRTGREEELFE
ncbi:MAG: hypothetical protein ACE5LH_00915 [Fidelibacterota bacterium]